MVYRKKYLHLISEAVYDLPGPLNLSYAWSLGSILGIFFVHQVISGIFLAVHYIPDVNIAFENMFYIQRDISTGWLLRLLHANGASFLMFICYLHMGRAIMFSSYSRVGLVWYSGLVLILFMMAAAFLGYVLPWGQMSFWGATVITNLFSVIPFIGGKFVEILWGGYTVGASTLNRFYVIHFLVPLLMCPLVIIHMHLLHEHGSSNPLGSPSGHNSMPFHPYLSSMDLIGFWLWFFFAGVVVMLLPHLLGCPDNFEKANSMKTPIHIQPEWYFLPYYAMLRSIPHKTGGVCVMVASLFVFFILKVSHGNSCFMVNSMFRLILFLLFFGNIVVLGWIGACPLEVPFLFLGLFHTIFYFIYFMLDLLLILYGHGMSRLTSSSYS